MNPNEEKLINDLNHHANDHTPTLVPHPFFEGKFQPFFFYVDGHADLLLTVRALVYLSMRTLDPELGTDDVQEKREEVYIRQALIVANRLMPNGEEALMDHLNRFYREEKNGHE
ncbi:hypothetical protein [Flagellimonas algicola]|uniref:Uncharacterized protein n=1 Tax=Flagellimonas algicola TaxID=2583815 RepID=A0ABY2WIW6_9FLAO|nr:hypothetical protein [Allomuricauda algicola]TMU54585.1 hypothetical protein FGG15_10245 [Allomuricauda algicola]